MKKAIRISLVTATFFSMAMPAGAHEHHDVGCCGLATLPPLTIPPFPTIPPLPPLGGPVGVVGGSGTVQGGGGTGGFSSGFSLLSSPSSGPLSFTQPGGGFSLPSGGVVVGGGSN